ncbi:hypothetical protein EV714DRAFT_208921 [Schizophyllum commune]
MPDAKETSTTSQAPNGVSESQKAGRKAKSSDWRGYTDKYEDDRLGEELGNDARVWRVLIDEGRDFDAAMLQRFRDHLDVDLVFAGLFSAVVTTFVAQTSAPNPPDDGSTSIALLRELVAIHRAQASNMPLDTVLAAASSAPPAFDLSINRCWFLSLAFSLFSAFGAVVVRQWIQEYEREISGSPKRRALIRHFRHIGLEKWQVNLIIPILPMLLHVSLLLFFIGLVLYVRQSDPVMSKGIFFITAVFYMVYFTTSFLPVLFPQCPYRSPLSTGGIWLKSLGAWLVHAMRGNSQQSRPYVLKTPADREWDAVAKCPKGLIPHSMERAMRESPSLSVALTVIQAASSFTVGLDHDHSQYPDKEHRKCALLRESILAWLYGALTSRRAVFEWAPGRENELQRLACCLLLVPLDKLEKKELDRQQYCMCGIRIWTALEQAIISREVMDAAAPSVCATLLALGQRLKVLDHRYNVPVNCALQNRMIEVYAAMIKRSPHTRLRLRPVVWQGMLESLTSCPASTEISLPFALALWRSLNCSTSYVPKDDSPGNAASSTIMTLQAWLYATRQSNLVAQGVIHRFLCPPACQVLPRLDDRLSSASDASTISTTSTARSDTAWLHMACRAIDLYVGMDDASRGAAFSDHLGFLAEQFVLTLANDLGYGLLDTALQIVGRPRVSSTFESSFHPRSNPGLGEMIKPDEGLPDDLVGPLFWFLVDLLQAVVDAPAGHDHNAAPQGDKATKEIAHVVEHHVQRHREHLVNSLIEDVDSLELLRPLAMTIITHPELAALSVFTDALADKLASLLRRLASGVTAQPHADTEKLQVVDAGRGDQPSQDLIWCMWVDAFCRGSGQASAAASDALHGVLLCLSRIHQDAWVREVASINSHALSVPNGMTLRSPRSREVLAELVPDAQAVFLDAVVSVPPNIRRIFVVDPDRHGNDSDSFVSISEIVTFDECRRRMRAGMPEDDAQSHASDAGKSEDDGEAGRWPISRRHSSLKDTWTDSALRWVRRLLGQKCVPGIDGAQTIDALACLNAVPSRLRMMPDLKGGAHATGAFNGPYDYEEKYEEDRYGEEFGPNARVWRALLDEARAYDSTTVKGWRDTLDVYLVFTGLFSAVVTTFVVQTSQSLQPDYGEINTALLMELIAVQRASANGRSVDGIPSSSLMADSITASLVDYWGNRFWYLSLALSLFAAFMAVLLRQWLQEYTSAVSGSARHRARVWQYRYLGLQNWRVPLLVALLPMLLHAALLVFFIGLILYVTKSDPSMAWVLAALTTFFYSLYILSNALPMLYPQCPYRTPVSHYGYLLFHSAFAWLRRLFRKETASPQVVLPPFLRARTPGAREVVNISTRKNELALQSLTWAFSTSSDPSLATIVVQAASGLQPDWWTRPLRASLLTWFRSTLTTRTTDLDWETGRERKLERYACALLLSTADDDRDNGHSDFGGYRDEGDGDGDGDDEGSEDEMLRMCISRVLQALGTAIRSRDADEQSKPILEATAIALSDRLYPNSEVLTEQFPALFLGPSSALDRTRSASDADFSWEGSSLAGTSPPNSLRLRPIVWKHMLKSLVYSRFMPSQDCLYLALFLWRSVGLASNFKRDYKRDVKGIVTLQWLCTTEGQDRELFRGLAQQAIHHLLPCALESCNVLQSESHANGTSSTSSRARPHPSRIQEDHGAWLHILRRAMKECAARQNEFPVEVGQITFADIIRDLARDFIHILYFHPLLALDFPDVSALIFDSPHVSVEVKKKFLRHQRLLFRFQHRLAIHESHNWAVTGGAARFNILVKLLSATTVVFDSVPMRYHAQQQIFKALRPMLDGPSDALFDAAFADELTFLERMRPLAEMSLNEPESAPCASSFSSMLAVYFQHATHGSQTSSSDVRSCRDLIWCIWIDIIATTQLHALSPLHNALLAWLGGDGNQRDECLREVVKATKGTLPLTLGMALNDAHGTEALTNILSALGVQNRRRSSIEPGKIVVGLCVQVPRDADGAVNEAWTRAVLSESEEPINGQTLPISRLLPLDEFHKRAGDTPLSDIHFDVHGIWSWSGHGAQGSTLLGAEDRDHDGIADTHRCNAFGEVRSCGCSDMMAAEANGQDDGEGTRRAAYLWKVLRTVTNVYASYRQPRQTQVNGGGGTERAIANSV